MRTSLVLLIISIFATSMFAKKTTFFKYQNPVNNKIDTLRKSDIKYLAECIYKYHPCEQFIEMQPAIDSMIDKLRIPSEPLSITDRIKLSRQVLDTFIYYDPHICLMPYIMPKKGAILTFDNIHTCPFEVININDSLIVTTSISKLLQKGDLILTINNTKATDFTKAYYDFRYASSISLLGMCNLDFNSNYQIDVLRDSKIKTINTKGISFSQYSRNKRFFTTKIFDDAKSGYISYSEFEHNTIFIKELIHLGKKLKRKKYNNIIIDLRGNSGGNGEAFDDLFSLFSNKDSISYLSDHKIRISDETIKIWELQDSTLGKIIALPEKDIVHKFPLKKEMFLGDFNYYVLISNYTASMAASFANMMQYNNIAKLVGEPLHHNALNYGEVIQKANNYAAITISTAEIEEYTKARNGILYPDIMTPYIAKEYMQGGDPVLEKLLETIKEN